MNRLLSPAGDIIPDSERTLVYFASYLARTVRHSTIKTYLAAVCNLHIASGYGDSLQGRLLLKKGFCGECSATRAPLAFVVNRLPPRVLLAIRPILQSWLGFRYFAIIWAAFTLAFFAFLWCNEYTYPGVNSFNSHFNLTTDCITFYPSLECAPRLHVTLKSSKTDSFKQGHSLFIAWCLSLLSPVSAMHQLFSLGQSQSGPLFSFRSGRLLTRSSVSYLLRDSARSAGLPCQSLRVIVFA